MTKRLNIPTHMRIITQMGRFTVYIPGELKARMDSLSNVNWPEVMKTAILKKLGQVRKFEELAKGGKI